MTNLFVETGIIVLTAFISSFGADRKWVRDLVGDHDFNEVYCSCPLDICEQRDAKGIYHRARSGEVKEFTGISSPLSAPLKSSYNR
jgi:adenylylsulfate kinase